MSNEPNKVSTGTSDRECDKSKRLQRIVWSGFIFILALTFLVGNVVSQHLKTVVGDINRLVSVNNEKMLVAFNMRDSIRQRTIVIQMILSSNDPFKISEYQLQIYNLSGKFRTSLSRLRRLGLDEKDVAFIETIVAQTKIAQPLVRGLIDIVMSYEDSQNIVRNKTVDAVYEQRKLLDILEEFVNYQSIKAADTATKAQLSYNNSMYSMYVGGGLLIFFGILTGSHVSRYVTTINRQLLRNNNELKHANYVASEASKAKSKFLANMSHELRTPLHSIIGFSSIIRAGDAGPTTPEQKIQLHMINSSANHLAELVDDILDLSKIEADEFCVHKHQFSLVELVTQITLLLRSAASEKNLVLNTTLNFDKIELYTNEKMLRQIIINLLSNAVKFTERGEISISVNATDNNLVIDVTDSGIGIDNNLLKNIFDPFKQGQSGDNRQHEGTGLGLAICVKMIKKLGGSIAVNSEVGEGSSFRVELKNVIVSTGTELPLLTELNPTRKIAS